jgi:hypothetical protein
MRKIITIAVAGAALAVVPALAAKPANKPAHPPKPAKCKVHSVGYNAKGTLESQSLTQTKGADTATKSDDRWSGDITVTVTKANHKGLTGPGQSFTLDNAKVRWYDADHNGTADTPAAGDRVGLHGKVTKLGKKCDQTGFTATVTVKKVDFKKAKTAPTA